ncbi:MAG: hypothetical protein AB1427_08675 [Thermodesulfobacteriota bacterium]
MKSHETDKNALKPVDISSELKRLEEKIDKIIRFFNIDQAPKRSRVELQAEVDAKILKLMERKKKRKSNKTR